MFTPNRIGTLERVSGTDVYAQSSFAAATECPFAVVNAAVSLQKTSVRADSSASRGTSDEIVAERAKILVPAFISIAQGDRFNDGQRAYKVVTIHERFDIAGVKDHTEVDLETLP